MQGLVFHIRPDDRLTRELHQEGSTADAPYHATCLHARSLLVDT